MEGGKVQPLMMVMVVAMMISYNSTSVYRAAAGSRGRRVQPFVFRQQQQV
jgi:hypothetical protein